TASWFPVSAVSVKTSATTYRRVIRASRSRTPPLRFLERSDCTLCVQDDPEANERERDLREHREDYRLRQLVAGIREHGVEPGIGDQERGRDGGGRIDPLSFAEHSHRRPRERQRKTDVEPRPAHPPGTRHLARG